MEDFQQSQFRDAIYEGNFGKVKQWIENDSCYVNQNIGREKVWKKKNVTERPLSVSLQNTKSKKANGFKFLVFC